MLNIYDTINYIFVTYIFSVIFDLSIVALVSLGSGLHSSSTNKQIFE